MDAASATDPARIAHRPRLGSNVGKGFSVIHRSGWNLRDGMMRARGTGAGTRLVVLLLIVCATPWLASGALPVAARQDTAPVPIEIGAGPVREQAFALVGRTIYDDDSALLFGYLTDVIGLDPALVFADALPAAQTARFTYAGEIPLSSRTNRGDVTQFGGEGTVTIFYDEDAGADWAEPPSFADGEPVAEFSLSLHDTLQRQAPAIGVVVGDERYRQEVAGEVVIDGEPYRFGQSGSEGRLRTVGALIDSESASELVAGLTGAGSIAVREAIPVIPGESAA
jgi:hypothetical protein